MSFEVYDRLLRIVVSSETPPHEVIAALLVQFLEWEPRDVVEHWSDHSLRDLVAEIEDQFVQSGFDRRYPETRLRPLRPRLDESVLAVLSRDANTAKAYRRILASAPGFGAKPVGDARLRDFLGDRDPGMAVVRWRAAVERYAIKTYVALQVVEQVGAVGLPHWALVFAFIRLLGWEPRRLVQQVMHEPLAVLMDRVRDGLMQDKRLPPDLPLLASGPLAARLECRVRALVEQERARRSPAPLHPALDVPPGLLDRVAGVTTPAEYLTAADRELLIVLWALEAALCALA